MVGGGPVTKAVFHVTRGPMSLPSFVHDVGWAFGEFVNEQSYNFAAGLPAAYPLVAPEGGKEPLLAQDTAYTMGSDHDVYQDSSFKIPAIYLNDWPDRYIHTNFDTTANIDPTKLKRAAFIGAASGYFLASMTTKNLPEVQSQVQHGIDLWKGSLFPRLNSLPAEDAMCLDDFRAQYDWGVQIGLIQFVHDSRKEEKAYRTNRPSCAADRGQANGGDVRYRRKPAPRGPVAVFGSDYVNDRTATAGITPPKILSYEGLWGSGEEYAYEVLNFVDGLLDAQQIRDRVSAEYGPIPVELVAEYLGTLEKIGVLERAK